jgi:hypothetical protein
MMRHANEPAAMPATQSYQKQKEYLPLNFQKHYTVYNWNTDISEKGPLNLKTTPHYLLHEPHNSATANKRLFIFWQILRKIYNTAVNSWFSASISWPITSCSSCHTWVKGKFGGVATTWKKPTDNFYQAKWKPNTQL